ncbi:MAG: hypothetical protein Q4G30_01570 [Actinomycetaceae bacterium]|nr:hypothetical protein [Actinomycetaceae bacterium]
MNRRNATQPARSIQKCLRRIKTNRKHIEVDVRLKKIEKLIAKIGKYRLNHLREYPSLFSNNDVILGSFQELALELHLEICCKHEIDEKRILRWMENYLLSYINNVKPLINPFDYAEYISEEEFSKFRKKIETTFDSYRNDELKLPHENDFEVVISDYEWNSAIFDKSVEGILSYYGAHLSLGESSIGHLISDLLRIEAYDDAIEWALRRTWVDKTSNGAQWRQLLEEHYPELFFTKMKDALLAEGTARAMNMLFDYDYGHWDEIENEAIEALWKADKKEFFRFIKLRGDTLPWKHRCPEEYSAKVRSCFDYLKTYSAAEFYYYHELATVEGLDENLSATLINRPIDYVNFIWLVVQDEHLALEEAKRLGLSERETLLVLTQGKSS